jgi:glutamate synthase (NADPH/NADH) small chain
VAWLLKIGGIKIKHNQLLGKDFSLSGLLEDYDAIFLGVGLGDVRRLDIDGEDLNNIQDAVEFISSLRQSNDLSKLEVGSNVVVIGGGMTAIDAAVQSKLLGAGDVTVVYRRSMEEMPASKYEQELAKTKGVKFVYNAKPVQIIGNEQVTSLKFQKSDNGSEFILPVDHLLKAIGQIMDELPTKLSTEGGKIKVDKDFKTDLADIWAGGDCTCLGEDLTVTAVAQGRDAAINIHASLSGEK